MGTDGPTKTATPPPPKKKKVDGGMHISNHIISYEKR